MSACAVPPPPPPPVAPLFAALGVPLSPAPYVDVLEHPVRGAHRRVVGRCVFHPPRDPWRGGRVNHGVHRRAAGIAQRNPVTGIGERNGGAVTVRNRHAAVRYRAGVATEHHEAPGGHAHAKCDCVHRVICRGELEVLKVHGARTAIGDLDPFSTGVGHGRGVCHELVDHQLAGERGDRFLGSVGHKEGGDSAVRARDAHQGDRGRAEQQRAARDGHLLLLDSETEASIYRDVAAAWVHQTLCEANITDGRRAGRARVTLVAAAKHDRGARAERLSTWSRSTSATGDTPFTSMAA